MSAARSIARNTAVQLGGDVLSKAASLLFLVVLARELGAEGLGVFTFALSLGVLLAIVFGIGVDDLLVRELARDRTRSARLTVDALGVKLVGGAAVLAITGAVALLGDYSPAMRAALMIVAVAAVVEQGSATLGAVLQSREEFAPVSGALVVQRWVTALLGVGAVLLGAAVVAACLAYLTGALVALAVSVVAVRRSGLGALPAPSRQSAGRLATQSVPIGLSGIFNAVLFRIDASMLAFLTSTAAVGLYGAAYRLFETTLTLSYAFVAALMPLLARVGGSDRSALNFTFALGCKLLIVVLFPIGLCFVLFAAPIVDLLYGPQFSASASALRLLGGAVALYGLAYLCSYVLLATDRQRLVPWVTGIGAMFNIALNAVAIPLYSVDGAAAVTTLTQIGLTVVMVALVVRETGRIAIGPVVGGALAGCLVLAAVAVALGPTWQALAGGAVLYVLVVAAWERWRHPEDLRAARLALVRVRA